MKAVEGQARGMHDRMSDEILRVARTDLRLGQAILDFYDTSLKYDEQRKRSQERTRERQGAVGSRVLSFLLKRNPEPT